MRIKKKIGIGFFCLLLLACSTNDLSSINSENPPIGNVFNLEQDWRHVDLPDTVVVLGSDMRNVPASERPQMRVSLENDFFLMRHEVTCGEFNALMNSSHGLVLKCSKKDVPATNVTFYDAVLYANELSKNQNMDTAYSYSVAVYDKDKHCVNLEGFVFHPEVNAFRLPTEAEWVYVASKNWDSAKGWTADNSEYKLHPVCSLASENDFCDMMGNAMEWVNDWLGNLQDTIVPNYVGATDGGAFDQRVVKGGSFRNAAATITLFSRGDVYKVTSSSLSDYLGFRLAFGSISNPTWMFGNGKISGSKIVPVASLNKLQSYISSKNIKLAFRDDLSGNLAYIDYMGSSLSVFEIDDSLDVYHPEISPDGKKVAFCTGIEGVSGESQLYVRDLNAEGANLVKLDVKNAAIPRWRVLDNGDTVIVSSKRTLFLDFGGTTGRAFVGDNYGTHARLLVVDSSGNLVQTVAAPNGYTFDHTEWTSSGNLAVATLTNINGAHEKVVLINLSDGRVVDLVEGDELWHPALWVQRENFVANVLLDPDSAGVYLTVTDDPAAAILRYKLELLWTYKDWANVVVLGSSRPQGGIVSNNLPEPFRTLNLANVPNMMTVSDYLARNYVFPHVKNLKYLVVSLDIDLWHKEEHSEYNFFYKNYKKYPGFVYDENHDFWKNGYPEGLAEMTTYSMGMEYYQNVFIPSRGYDYAQPGTWEEFPAVENDSTWMSSCSENFYAALSHLENILKMAENRSVYVIGVVFPQSPNYRNTGSFGRYGIRRSEAPRLLKEIENLKTAYPHFVFWDENKMGFHDYTDIMASNRDHLSAYGAIQFTERLNILLDSLEGIVRP